MATPMPQQPFCPTCGSPAVWHAAIGQWGCDRCRQMLPNQAPPQMQPPMPPQPQGYVPSAPPCPRCGGPTVWHASANNWGCDRCREMLPPPQQFTPQPESSAATVFARVLIVVVLIIVVIVIKVWARGGFR